MKIKYDTQIDSLAATFIGPARQIATRALGLFAVRMGGLAILLVPKCVAPAAREVGKQLLNSTIPELGNVLAGLERTNINSWKRW